MMRWVGGAQNCSNSVEKSGSGCRRAFGGREALCVKHAPRGWSGGAPYKFVHYDCCNYMRLPTAVRNVQSGVIL